MQARAAHTLLTTALQVLPERFPLLGVCRSACFACKGPQPCGCPCDHTHGAAPHEGGRHAFAPCGTPFRVAMGAKKLLERAIRAGEISKMIAGPQARPGAAGALGDVGQHGSEGRGTAAWVCRHGAAPGPHVTFATIPSEGFGLGQSLGDPLHPGRGSSYHGPQASGVPSPFVDEALEPWKDLGQRPLFSTRSSEPAMALRRVWRVRPEASKGGRPSSVRALRTARQEPRITSAAGSGRVAS